MQSLANLVKKQISEIEMLQKGDKQWESKLKTEASKETSGRRQRRQFSTLSGSGLDRWPGQRLCRSPMRQAANSSPHNSGCCHDRGVKAKRNGKKKQKLIILRNKLKMLYYNNN